MNTSFFINKKSFSAYKELLEYLIKSKEKLILLPTIEQFELLEEMYQKVKEYSLYLYDNNDKFYFFYSKIINILTECENMVKGLNLDSNSSKYKVEEFIKVHSIETLLDFIVTNVRKKITDEYILYAKSSLNINNPHIRIDQLDLSGKCETISYYVKEEFAKFGIDCEIIRIDPAFSQKLNLYNNKGYHYFNKISFQGKEYIIDLSYSQFFKQDSSNMLSKLGVPFSLPCKPGIYMLIDKNRAKVATTIIDRGWIILTEENIKHYFDGFMLSSRNGLYYELLGKVEYQTEYDFDDYFNFLNDCDSVINYEPIEGLGYQKRPLKNPYINFKLNK